MPGDMKTATLAGQLQHFAQSVDIVDDGTFEAVRRLVYRYVSTELKGAYFELMQELVTGNGGRQIWIKTFWSSQNKQHFWPVHADEKNNPVAHAFDVGRPLWLVDANKGPLPGTLWNLLPQRAGTGHRPHVARQQ